MEFEAAVELEPENPVHWHNLALARRLAGTLLEALTAIKCALNLNPNDPVALSLGHEMLLATGQLKEATRRAQQLLKLAPLDLLTLRRLLSAAVNWDLPGMRPARKRNSFCGARCGCPPIRFCCANRWRHFPSLKANRKKRWRFTANSSGNIHSVRAAARIICNCWPRPASWNANWWSRVSGNCQR